MRMGVTSYVPVVLTTFVWSIAAGDMLRVNCAYAAQLPMPAANQPVQLSAKYDEPTLRGIKVDPADPFKMTFVYDKGSDGKIDDATAKEMAQYFFAALVTPTKDLWVNLSPFEKDRVIEDAVAQTEIGDVFLAQDYLLKQLSSSLTSPETETGKAYWAALNGASADATVNKIWITPGAIKVYSDSTTTMIADAKLAVQTEFDYMAAKNGTEDALPAGVQAVRDIVVPQVLRDVNEGKNFAALRQMMHAIILAQMFKSKYGATVYGALIDSGKDKGLETGDPAMKGDVFAKYAASFENGVYRTTAKLRDAQGRKSKREYFCGGVSSAINNNDVTPVMASAIDTTNGVERSFQVDVWNAGAVTEKIAALNKIIGSFSSNKVIIEAAAQLMFLAENVDGVSLKVEVIRAALRAAQDVYFSTGDAAFRNANLASLFTIEARLDSIVRSERKKELTLEQTNSAYKELRDFVELLRSRTGSSAIDVEKTKIVDAIAALRKLSDSFSPWKTITTAAVGMLAAVKNIDDAALKLDAMKASFRAVEMAFYALGEGEFYSSNTANASNIDLALSARAKDVSFNRLDAVKVDSLYETLTLFAVAVNDRTSSSIVLAEKIVDPAQIKSFADTVKTFIEWAEQSAVNEQDIEKRRSVLQRESTDLFEPQTASVFTDALTKLDVGVLQRLGADVLNPPLASSSLGQNPTNGGIDLSGIVGAISLEGTGDPWSGKRMTAKEVAAVSGVALTPIGGFAPASISPVAH